MEDFRDSWVIDDSLEWIVEGPEYLRLRGDIQCEDGYYLHVDKLIRVKSDHQAKALKYTYQAMWSDGFVERQIFRYDNAHPHKGHLDEYHKHTWNPLTEKEYPCAHIGYALWPVLSEVIQELQDWKQEHHLQLMSSVASY